MREVCRASFQLADSNLEEGTFRGYASVFNTPIDAYVPTVIHPGAFTKTLQENARRVRILWQHNDNEPIGLPVSMEENAIGLEVVGRISKTVRGLDCLTLMRDKVVTDLSIGFDMVKSDMEEREGQPPLRHGREVRLWEFSPVTWGANAPAQITEVNGRAHVAGLSDAAFIQCFLDRIRDHQDADEAARLLLAPLQFYRNGQLKTPGAQAHIREIIGQLEVLAADTAEPPADKPADPPPPSDPPAESAPSDGGEAPAGEAAGGEAEQQAAAALTDSRLTALRLAKLDMARVALARLAA